MDSEDLDKQKKRYRCVYKCLSIKMKNRNTGMQCVRLMATVSHCSVGINWQW